MKNYKIILNKTEIASNSIGNKKINQKIINFFKKEESVPPSFALLGGLQVGINRRPA